MNNNFCVNLTHSIDDPDRATVALVVANAAAASGKNTMIFLSSEGVRLAAKGIAAGIHEEGFQPMADLLKNFVQAGGAIWVCSPWSSFCPTTRHRSLISTKVVPAIVANVPVQDSFYPEQVLLFATERRGTA